MEVAQIGSDALHVVPIGEEHILAVRDKLVVGHKQVVKGSMVLGVIHRRVAGYNISLDNLEVGIEEHITKVDTVEVHHIEVNRIMASLDNIEVAEHIKVEDFDDARQLLL